MLSTHRKSNTISWPYCSTLSDRVHVQSLTKLHMSYYAFNNRFVSSSHNSTRTLPGIKVKYRSYLKSTFANTDLERRFRQTIKLDKNKSWFASRWNCCCRQCNSVSSRQPVNKLCVMACTVQTRLAWSNNVWNLHGNDLWMSLALFKRSNKSFFLNKSFMLNESQPLIKRKAVLIFCRSVRI